METPEKEIETVIQMLTQGDEAQQVTALHRYFTKNAAFVHPFCRVPSTSNSRWSLQKIYRWYKIMSPKIGLDIKSVAWDKEHLKLYVTLSQVFSIWFFPLHKSPVTLTTVLDLQQEQSATQNKTLYYITKQEDFYQTCEFIKFVVPYIGGILVQVGQVIATWFCVLAVYVFWPGIMLKSGVASGYHKLAAVWQNDKEAQPVEDYDEALLDK